MTTSILQGFSLSPLLFVFCVNGVIDRTNSVWSEERWNVLMHEDDTVLLARSRRELIEKINVFKFEWSEIGLEVNKLKNEIMVVGEKEHIDIKKVIRYSQSGLTKKGTLKKTAMDSVQNSQSMRRYVNYFIGERQRKLELGRIM